MNQELSECLILEEAIGTTDTPAQQAARSVNRVWIEGVYYSGHCRLAQEEEIMGKVTVRYFVCDVDSAVRFYCDFLGFSVDFRPAPTFAALSRGDLILLVNETAGPGGAAQPMPDGQTPQPGGWNRIQIEVGSIEPEVARLKEAGARFRNEIVSGFGGKQVLLEDPSRNPIELFESGQART